MTNKKGFTLIELLAVIVVLAIIALITIPVITSVIDKAKLGALKDSGYGILDAAEMYLAKNMSEGITDTMEFVCNNGVCLSGEEKITYKGQIDSGKVRIYSDNKIELCIENDNASALKTVASKEIEVSTGTCDYGKLNYGVTALVSKTALDEANKKYNDLKALIDQTDATEDDIKEGKKAYSNGELLTGVGKDSIEYREGTLSVYGDGATSVQFSTAMENVPNKIFVQPISNTNGYAYAVTNLSSVRSITNAGFIFQWGGYAWSGAGGAQIIGTTATYKYIALYIPSN